ncbi:MAG: hypothetical protein QXS44_02760 [Saccharolobus sp.]
MSKYKIAGIIAVIMAIFFIVISIPLNFFSSNIIGALSTSILMSAIYMILAAIVFLVLYRGINKL